MYKSLPHFLEGKNGDLKTGVSLAFKPLATLYDLYRDTKRLFRHEGVGKKCVLPTSEGDTRNQETSR